MDRARRVPDEPRIDVGNDDRPRSSCQPANPAVRRGRGRNRSRNPSDNPRRNPSDNRRSCEGGRGCGACLRRRQHGRRSPTLDRFRAVREQGPGRLRHAAPGRTVKLDGVVHLCCPSVADRPRRPVWSRRSTGASAGWLQPCKHTFAGRSEPARVPGGRTGAGRQSAISAPARIATLVGQTNPEPWCRSPARARSRTARWISSRSL